MFRRTVKRVVHSWKLSGLVGRANEAEAARMRLQTGKSTNHERDLRLAARSQQHQAQLDAYRRKHGGN